VDSLANAELSSQPFSVSTFSTSEGDTYFSQNLDEGEEERGREGE